MVRIASEDGRWFRMGCEFWGFPNGPRHRIARITDEDARRFLWRMVQDMPVTYGGVGDDWRPMRQTMLEKALARDAMLGVAESEGVLRGYPWVTVCPPDIATRFGGADVLRGPAGLFTRCGSCRPVRCGCGPPSDSPTTKERRCTACSVPWRRSCHPGSRNRTWARSWAASSTRTRADSERRSTRSPTSSSHFPPHGGRRSGLGNWPTGSHRVAVRAAQLEERSWHVAGYSWTGGWLAWPR